MWLGLWLFFLTMTGKYREKVYPVNDDSKGIRLFTWVNGAVS